MENVELTKFDIFQNKRIFITGHSGFKGSWLSTWLEMLGAEVFGYSNFNSNFEHHNLLKDSNVLEKLDVRDFPSLKSQIEQFNPDLIFHLAAQALVSVGYESPVYTWDVNLNGTLNVLKSLSAAPNLRGAIIVTSDKVYLDDGNSTGHLETDTLGGHDPYSASKAAVEMLVESYLNCNKLDSKKNTPTLITARAGNVIGGGDFSRDRIFPDIYKAIEEKKPLIVRMPNAQRPWQHVLDCINGYLELGAKMLSEAPPSYPTYNFGPTEFESLSVRNIVNLAQERFSFDCVFPPEGASNTFHERHVLQVASTRAKQDLGWQPKLSQLEAISWTLEWYEKYRSDAFICTKTQIERFSNLLVE